MSQNHEFFTMYLLHVYFKRYSQSYLSNKVQYVHLDVNSVINGG